VSVGFEDELVDAGSWKIIEASDWKPLLQSAFVRIYWFLGVSVDFWQAIGCGKIALRSFYHRRGGSLYFEV
jgi:hypothetical protein